MRKRETEKDRDKKRETEKELVWRRGGEGREVAYIP